MRQWFITTLLLLLAGSAPHAQTPATATTTTTTGTYYEVNYPASTKVGELAIPVTYTLWVPEDGKTLRGIIVHQHGCGTGASEGGKTAAYDLHWQTLARRWDCALLGPSYGHKDEQNCRVWCDPRNGSAARFLQGLEDLTAKSGHPEIARVPWCLWGNSGGGFWVSMMHALYPERIVAVWCRSGTYISAWGSGEKPEPVLTAAVYGVPVMCNPGIQEKGDKQFNAAWTGTLEMFQKYRAKGAPIGFAPDPQTGHSCGMTRYLAIPFFDACLRLRLPERKAADQSLKPVVLEDGWLAEVLSNHALPALEYTGEANDAVWLPDDTVAHAWEQYVKTGDVKDSTPPPAPFHVQAAGDNGAVTVTWEATADLESGLRQFIILREGQEVGRIPAQQSATGRTLFQGLSYHDTPYAPKPAMRFVDSDPQATPTAVYTVRAVNSVGLESN